MIRNLFTPEVTKKVKIGFLSYLNIRGDTRRHGQDFFNQKNFGAAMIIDILFKNGYDVKITTAEFANNYDILLVSLTSVLDMISFTRVAEKYNFRNRKNIIVAGGFGMQNYIPIHEYIDYAWFGRVENDLIELIQNNFDIEHRSLIKIGKHKDVYMNQSLHVYDSIYEYGKGYYKENMLGCPNKCFFCHYTFARKYVKIKKGYTLQQSSKASIEIECLKKELYTNLKIGEVYSAIDGYSERLRFAYNKKIENYKYEEFIRYITDTTKCKAIRMRWYNIIGYETETENDYLEFVENISKINNLKKYCTLIIHSTPFNPSTLTPGAFAPINLKYNYNKYKVGKGIKHGINVIYENNSIKVLHDFFQEDASSLLEHTIPIRTTFDNLDIFKRLALDKKYDKLTTNKKIDYMFNVNGFNDIIREYDISEYIPTEYVKGYVPYDKIRAMRSIIKKRLLIAR
jgi:hypothetical protein